MLSFSNLINGSDCPLALALEQVCESVHQSEYQQPGEEAALVAGAGAEEAVVVPLLVGLPWLEASSLPVLPQLASPARPHGGVLLGVGVWLVVHHLLVSLRHEGDLVLREVHVIVNCAALYNTATSVTYQGSGIFFYS